MVATLPALAIQSHPMLEVVLTRTYGDPDLYVSDGGSLPTTDTASAKSTSQDADYVRIDQPKVGVTYYIGG